MTQRSEGPDGAPLREQTDALRGYLEELLAGVPADETVAESPAAEPSPAPEPDKPELRVVPETVPVEHKGQAPATAGDAEPSAEAATAAPAAGAPEWAHPAFQALLFSVGELQLAVPLVKLHSVIPWNDHISTMPRQPRWAHGMMRYRERNVLVIDTARLVLPAAHADADARNGQPEHILIVGDGRWGLACRRIGEVIRLAPDEVRWRGRQGRRPWLAGTVLGRLCALMDTGAFADMLNNGSEGAALRARITEN